MGDWPAELPKDLPVVSTTFYDLKQEIKDDVGIYSKERLVESKALVEKEVGKELIEKSKRFGFSNVQPVYGESPELEEMMLIHIRFNEEDKARDPRYQDRTFVIYNGKIERVIME